MSRAEQVQRVLDACIVTTYIDTSDVPWSDTVPMFDDTEDSRKFIRRILAAAEGRRSVFHDLVVIEPRTPVRHGKRRNPEGAMAYAMQKRVRAQQRGEHR